MTNSIGMSTNAARSMPRLNPRLVMKAVKARTIPCHSASLQGLASNPSNIARDCSEVMPLNPPATDRHK